MGQFSRSCAWQHEYDLAGRPERVERYADLAGDNLVAATDYLFDRAGRLDRLTRHDNADPRTEFADYGEERCREPFSGRMLPLNGS